MNPHAQEIFRQADSDFDKVMREQLPLLRALEEVRQEYAPHLEAVIVLSDGKMSVGGKWMDVTMATVANSKFVVMPLQLGCGLLEPDKIFDTPEEAAAEFFRSWIMDAAVTRENARYAVKTFRCDKCKHLAAIENMHGYGQEKFCAPCDLEQRKRDIESARRREEERLNPQPRFYD